MKTPSIRVIIFITTLGLVLFLSAGVTLAQTVSAVARTQAVPIGQQVIIDVLISGLGNHVVPTLGAFDIDLKFDAGVLQFNTINFGTFLGTIPGQAVTGSTPGTGTLRAFQVSLLPAASLDAFQGASFTLFSITFDVLASGGSALNPVFVAPLSDGLGNPITSAAVSGGSVSTSIPIPTLSEWGLWLLIMSLAFVGIYFLKRVRA